MPLWELHYPPLKLTLQFQQRALITDGGMNVYSFTHTSSELDSDGTIHANAYNLKGARGFDGKFPFDCVIIL